MKSPVRITLTILLAHALVAAWSQSETAGMAGMLKVVEQYPRRIQSARIEGTEVFTPAKAFYSLQQVDQSKDHPDTKKQPVIWAFKGDKRYRQSVERFNPENQEQKYKLISRTFTQVFDGREQYNLIASRYSGQKTEIVQGSLGHTPLTDMPILNFGYKVFGQWVCDILQSEQCKLNGTENHPKLGKLYRFSVEKKAGLLSRLTSKGAAGEQIRFWLAPKYGFLAVRSESEGTAPPGHQRLVLRVDRAERRGSIWFPVEDIREWYSIEGNKETLLSTNHLRISRFELNNVPDSLFEVKLRPGYHIKESETNKYWKVGANGERIPIDMNRNEDGVMPLGWLFMTSLTSLLVLAAGVFLRWRRRSAS